MPTRNPTTDAPPLRADARRNQERLLAAAVDLFVEQGVDVPLEAIARQAEVGIGTLYRHFPDRDALVRDVALRAFRAVHDLAIRVADDVGDAAPLEAFMRGVADLRVGVLMASLLPVLQGMEDDPALQSAFTDVVARVTALVEDAHDQGCLRPDVDTNDILLVLSTVTRPHDGIPPEHADPATRRLLEIAIQGLRPGHTNAPLPAGPPPFHVVHGNH